MTQNSRFIGKEKKKKKQWVEFGVVSDNLKDQIELGLEVGFGQFQEGLMTSGEERQEQAMDWKEHSTCVDRKW